MIVLLGTTLTASFFDSLNPSAIVQQMVLQAMVKRKRQIWFFIFGIALANLLLGLAVYYGLAAWVWRWVEGLLQDHPLPVYGACGAGGAALFLLGVWLLWKTRQSRRQGVSQPLSTCSSSAFRRFSSLQQRFFAAQRSHSGRRAERSQSARGGSGRGDSKMRPISSSAAE